MIGTRARWVVACLTVAAAGCAAEPRASSVSETPLPSATESALASASPGVPIGPLPFGRIAYDRFDSPDSWEADHLGTFTLAADGTGELELVIDAEGNTFHPILSPDGTRLAITVFAPPMGPAVMAVVNVDGSDLVLLEPEGLTDGFLSCEDWSPDGARLVCTWDHDAHPDTEGIYSFNAADGSDVVRITTSPNPGVVGAAGECGGNDFNASYSPDGTEIVFVRGKCGGAANPSDDQTGALFRVGVDGSNLEEIVPPGDIHSHGVACPSWSPDGSQIVFVTEGGELELLATEGVVPIEIQGAATGRTYAFCPAWSPDGEWIITSLFTDATATTDLYIVHPDGTDLTRITDAPGTETYVSWATDGDPLAGTWSTGSVSFSDVHAAMLDAGLEDSDFAAWAEGQDLAPWPEDPATPSEIAMELRFTTDGRWEVSVESGGQSIGVVDAGTYELRDAELDLTSAADGDVGTFGAELGTDSLTLELLDTVEVGSADAAYTHQLYAIALFASAPFERD